MITTAIGVGATLLILIWLVFATTTKMEWMDASKKVPPNDDDVLLVYNAWGESPVCIIAFYEKDNDKWHVDNGEDLNQSNCLYWQPIPKFPENV